MNLIHRYLQQDQARKSLQKELRELTTLGARLASARKISGVSQTEAAAGPVKTAGLISKYETDRRRPSFESLKVLAELYKCPLQHLVPSGDPYEGFLAMIESGPSDESSLAFHPGIATARIKDDRNGSCFFKRGPGIGRHTSFANRLLGLCFDQVRRWQPSLPINQKQRFFCR